MATNEFDGTRAVPSVSTAAVLKQSIEMPAGAQKVEELNFDNFAGHSITVEDLISGTSNMGFQASSIGEAVRIINEMVWSLPQHYTFPACFTSSRTNTTTEGLAMS
jgi:deoxyhypusine synthase